MTSTVKNLTERVMALPADERHEFFAWLAEYETQQLDQWDRQLAQDSRPGGRLQPLMERARADIQAKRVKAVDEVIKHA